MIPKFFTDSVKDMLIWAYFDMVVWAYHC
jgi:hypothetical protein